ncbi:hypothetical protein FA15DRAFT_585766 [Coprinopsis marcescibilis]|uniref:Beta-glucuronidase C-terminal domain-containing protein n=1 Tax=Coprinopsis marcescibilis TaxID=230819 RepID=A0A5C3L4X9_COPMA|nr:hypothetical protein FA15DRAFT_585766 [Coprinopsis marcescibilis]
MSSQICRILLPLLLSLHQVFSLDVTVPTSPPSAAKRIYRDHVSYSLEQDRWLDWVGTTSRNQFFINTLENIRKLSGLPPQIRVGANTEDRTNFNPNIEFVQLTYPSPTYNVPYPEATTVVVGDGYYAATRFLPKNSIVTWGLNLGHNNLTASFLMARSIAKTFASSAIAEAEIVLDAIEIGNEPDLYGNNGFRQPGYPMTQYIREWTAMANNVTSVLGISRSSRTKFIAPSLVYSTRDTTGWSPQTMFAQGMLDTEPGSLIGIISQHRYSGSFCAGSPALLQDLMTKATIRGNISFHNPDIAATKARGLEYVLGETNSFACHGAPGVSNVAGAALWTLDYLLYASHAGIDRIFFHQGIGFKYNFVQPATLYRDPVNANPLPTPLAPHVQPQYYAAIIAAEAIGPSGNTRIVELSVNDPRIAGYAFYEGQTLVRAVFIESTAFFKQASAPGTRRSAHIDLRFPNASLPPRTMSVKRLSVSYSDETSGLTWGGISYETSDALPSGAPTRETIEVSNGFNIQATEVVMLSFAN